MALDWAVRNKRIAAAAVAPVALGAAAVIAVAVSEPSAPSTAPTTLTASVTECHDMVSIAVGGRNDSPRPGTHAMLLDADGNPLPAASSTDFSSPWVDEVVNAPRDDVPEGSYSAVYVEYPANMSSYDDAVETGVDNAQTVMQAIREACPDTKFAVVGYSEGADVARRVAMEIGNQEAAEDGSYEIVDPDSVVGVVILADAGRQAGEGPFPGAEDEFRNPDGFDLAYQSGRNSASGSGSLPGTSGSFGALDGKVASFCSGGRPHLFRSGEHRPAAARSERGPAAERRRTRARRPHAADRAGRRHGPRADRNGRLRRHPVAGELDAERRDVPRRAHQGVGSVLRAGHPRCRLGRHGRGDQLR